MNFLFEKFYFKALRLGGGITQLSPYISSYLETTLPKHEKNLNLLLLSGRIQQDDYDLALRFHVEEYGLSYGLRSMVKEYNQFIINNELSTKRLANPLERINAFLTNFFHELKAAAPTEKNYEHHCKQVLKNLSGSLLNNALKGSLSYGLADLKSPFFLKLVALDTVTDQGYEGTAAVKKFLDLPKPQQRIILKVCSAAGSKTTQ